jgi:hypothetical protein
MDETCHGVCAGRHQGACGQTAERAGKERSTLHEDLHRLGRRLPNAQYCRRADGRCQEFAAVRNRSSNRAPESCLNRFAALT